MVHVVLLVGCAVTIYLACEWFVNAIEWLGVQLNVGHLAVGTILAAVGTALPESVVTLVAALFGGPVHGDDIAVGAALGGPLVVGTLAYSVTGAMLLVRRRGTPAAPVHALGDTDTAKLARDQTWFLAIFVVKVTLGLVAFTVKPWLGWLFFAVYALYFRRELGATSGAAAGIDVAPLIFQRGRQTPSRGAVLAQTTVTVVVIFAVSQLFVAQLEWAGPALGLPSVVVALLLSPMATELPEIMNAIIWVRQGKTHLALANISGAMMIQATVPSGIGLLLTPWRFDTALVLAAAATMASVVYLLALMRTRRITAGRLFGTAGFYAAFVAGLAVDLLR